MIVLNGHVFVCSQLELVLYLKVPKYLDFFSLAFRHFAEWVGTSSRSVSILPDTVPGL